MEFPQPDYQQRLQLWTDALNNQTDSLDLGVVAGKFRLGRFSHRKAWIVGRMRQLASVFCLNICAYAVMDNHYHVVSRVDTELAEALSVSEVSMRWLSLFSGSALIQRYLSSERDAMVDGEIAEVHALAEALRERLVDIS